MALSFLPSPRLARVLRERNIALVHLNSSVLVSAALTCRLAGIPVVWHVREVFASGFFGIRRRLLTAIIRKWSDAIICISEDEAAPFLHDAKALVAYNPVDLERFNPDRAEPERIRQELGLTSDTWVIGFVAAIAHHKGIFELVEAAEILVKSLSQRVRFLIVGSGSPSLRYEWDIQAKCLNRLRAYVDGRVEMERLIRAKGLEKYFLLTGQRTDIPNLVAAMDVVTFPSRLGAIGRAAIEAAALAKPVVATSESRRSGLVQDGKTGLLVPPCAPHALASALDQLIRHPEQARAMGQAGRKHALANFDSRIYARRITEVYSRVLQGEKSPAARSRTSPGQKGG